MERIVSEISLRRKRNTVRVVGYSKSDRGTKFVNGVVDINTFGKDKAVVDEAISKVIVQLLGGQADEV